MNTSSPPEESSKQTLPDPLAALRSAQRGHRDISYHCALMGDDLDELEVAVVVCDPGDPGKVQDSIERIRSALNEIRNRRITIMAISDLGLPDVEDGDDDESDPGAGPQGCAA